MSTGYIKALSYIKALNLGNVIRFVRLQFSNSVLSTDNLTDPCLMSCWQYQVQGPSAPGAGLPSLSHEPKETSLSFLLYIFFHHPKQRSLSLLPTLNTISSGIEIRKPITQGILLPLQEVSGGDGTIIRAHIPFSVIVMTM